MPQLKKVTVEETRPAVTIKVVKIQSLIEAQISLSGKATGRQYTWAKAGTIVEVDETDAPEFLQMRLGRRQCCGNSGNFIFQIVGGTHA